MSKLQKPAILAVFVLIALLAGTYYFFSGKEYVVRLTESDIQGKLEEKLPLSRTCLFIIQVTLNNPRVHLADGTNRVDAGLDVVFNITLDKNPKPLGGTVDASGGIIYLPEKGEFYLTDPAIENLNVQGIHGVYTEKVNEALTKALAEYYREHPIYTLHLTDLKQAAAKMIPRDVSAENSELVVTLGI